MEGRIKNHIVNALGDGEITPEELAQVDAFFEYSFPTKRIWKLK